MKNCSFSQNFLKLFAKYVLVETFRKIDFAKPTIRFRSCLIAIFVHFFWFIPSGKAIFYGHRPTPEAAKLTRADEAGSEDGEPESTLELELLHRLSLDKNLGDNVAGTHQKTLKARPGLRQKDREMMNNDKLF